METNIFVMTHKKYSEPKDPIYMTLHVGREGKEELSYRGDNTGNNISCKNSSFCELTGIYWLWKNYTCDIIGICHYRRFFMKDGKLLNKAYIEEILGTYDIIIPYSGATETINVWEHYEEKHVIGDLAVTRTVIEEMYPEYVGAFEHVVGCKLITVGNMLIAKKEIFDEYCKWLFDILFEVEKRIDLTGRDQYQGRVFGFISERLMRVWLLKQSYKIKEEAVNMVDMSELDNGIKRVELVYNLAQVMTKDIAQKYNEENYLELPKLENELAKENKTPVWICWWQGVDNAPDMVKKCIASVEKNLDLDKYVIKIIDFTNYNNYVNFSDNVVDKFNSGKISMTHLSDILRMQLLYRYGGVWIDATYFVNDVRINEYLENDFYTIKFGFAHWDADIVQGKWSGNFLKIAPNSKLCGFMVEAFERYWSMREDLIDYYMIDYFIAVAYNNITDVREMMDNCKPSNPNALSLSPICNRVYDETKWEAMKNDTCIYKLYHKQQYVTNTIVGRETFYNKIILAE